MHALCPRSEESNSLEPDLEPSELHSKSEASLDITCNNNTMRIIMQRDYNSKKLEKYFNTEISKSKIDSLEKF